MHNQAQTGYLTDYMVSDELVIVPDTEYVTDQAEWQQEQGHSRILLEVRPKGAVPWFHRRSCHELMGLPKLDMETCCLAFLI